MESVNNIASAASRALFGEQGQQNGSQNNNVTNTTKTNETGGVEPISGETGDVRRGEPYDKGNLDPSTTKSDSTPSTQNQTSATPSHAENESGKNAKSAFSNPASTTTNAGPTSANDSSGPGATPSVGANPSSGAQPKVKQQGADKPHDLPDSGESQKIQDTKREAEEAADTSKNADGPEPMSVEDKARQGGNAGAEAGAGGEEEDGPGKKSTGEGTGEKYVKSSGTKAEGGDFDAANPGAGREADRLLEEKGIHREAGESHGGDGGGGKDAAESSTKSQKHGLGEKIKAKLHKH